MESRAAIAPRDKCRLSYYGYARIELRHYCAVPPAPRRYQVGWPRSPYWEHDALARRRKLYQRRIGTSKFIFSARGVVDGDCERVSWAKWKRRWWSVMVYEFEVDPSPFHLLQSQFNALFQLSTPWGPIGINLTPARSNVLFSCIWCCNGCDMISLLLKLVVAQLIWIFPQKRLTKRLSIVSIAFLQEASRTHRDRVLCSRCRRWVFDLD